MNVWRAIAGAIAGLVLTIALVWGLSELTVKFFNALRQGDLGEFRLAALWLLLLGLVVGAVILASRASPLAAAVPTVLLLIIYGPFYANFDIPTWFPDSLEERILTSDGVTPPLVIGLMAAAALRPLFIAALRPLYMKAGRGGVERHENVS